MARSATAAKRHGALTPLCPDARQNVLADARVTGESNRILSVAVLAASAGSNINRESTAGAEEGSRCSTSARIDGDAKDACPAIGSQHEPVGTSLASPKYWEEARLMRVSHKHGARCLFLRWPAQKLRKG